MVCVLISKVQPSIVYTDPSNTPKPLQVPDKILFNIAVAQKRLDISNFECCNHFKK